MPAKRVRRNEQERSMPTIPEGNVVLCGLQDGLTIVVKPDQDLGILPLREDVANVAIEAQQSLLNTLQRSNGGDEL